MKNFKITLINTFIVLMLSILLFSSCNDDQSNDSASNPVITSVVASAYDEITNLPADLTPVTKGDPKNYYIIRGTGLSSVQKIYFNNFDTYFNPVLVTDTEIFVLIDENTPYANASNELKVVTKMGTVIYPFIVAPPSPTFGSFNPINATEGTEVTIYGKYFLNPVVTIAATATEPAINVPVISSSLEKIIIKIPANAQNRYITVANISGKATSKEAIGTAIYDDTFYGSWTIESWNNHTYETDSSAQQGTTYIKKKMGAWDNMQGNWGWDDQIEAYGGIRISIKGSKPGTLKFIFNGDWSERNMLEVKTEWTTYEIPWSALGNADHVQNISFQNMSKEGSDGIANEICIDNLGYFLK
jgi:hypothetical protein